MHATATANYDTLATRSRACLCRGGLAFNAMLFSSSGVSVLSDRHPGHTPGPAMSSLDAVLRQGVRGM